MFLSSILAASIAVAPARMVEPLPGCEREFLQALNRTAQLSTKKDWVRTKAAAQLLPSPLITMEWKDATVPADQRTEFRAARDAAIKAWQLAIGDMKVQLVQKQARIQFGFQDTLPPNEDTAGPAGAVYFVTYTPKEPAVEAILALRRTARKQRISQLEVYNETLHAIGLALGLARSPRAVGATSRVEDIYSRRHPILEEEVRLAKDNLRISNLVRQSAQQKALVQVASPTLGLDRRDVDLGTSMQGEIVPFSVQIANSGKGTLRYSVIPDCSCFALGAIDPIPAGESQILRLAVQTENWPGTHQKELYIFSNDPEAPLKIIRVKFTAKPRFRFLTPNPTNVFQLPEDGLLQSIYLALDPQSPLKIRSATLNGREGAVSLTEWKGTLPDPELREGPRLRTGFSVKVLLSPDIGSGRVPLSLELLTDDPSLPLLRYSFFVQKGIASMPPSVYFGDLGKNSQQATVVLSKPGAKFIVTQITSGSKWVKAKVEPLPNGDQRIIVFYVGGAPKGELSTEITVTTSDKQQSKIVIPITGFVK